MKFSKLITVGLALTAIFMTSCERHDPEDEAPISGYENGILITNEGGFSTPTASVSFLSNDFSVNESDIFAKNNNSEKLGNVLQSISFKGDLAYLVVNKPSKIEIVNRNNFQKTATITTNLDQPRYIAFHGNHTYVTNNNFYDVKKVSVFDAGNQFVKDIQFPRYADKITSSGGYIYVQTDGVDYTPNEVPTGHTISRINPANNEVDKEIILTDNAPIRDMVSDQNFVYVLTSDDQNTYLYTITADSGIFNKTQFSGITQARNLALDQGKIYFFTGDNNVHAVTGNSSAPLFHTNSSAYVYGFNVIGQNVFISEPSFTSDSTVKIFNLSGALVKTLSTGIGTNGFYKN